MVTSKKILSGIVAIALAGTMAMGCAKKKDTIESTVTSIKELDYISLEGKPISVAKNCYDLHCNLALVLDVEGKSIVSWNAEALSMNSTIIAEALIKSKIGDGKNEPIQLIGKYDGIAFEFYTLKTKEYVFDLAKTKLDVNTSQ